MHLLRYITAVVIGCMIILPTTRALAQDVTLDIHHFVSARAPAHAAFIEPWARRIEAQSEGRIAVDVYPDMTLGGRPQELFDQVAKGTVDIVWTVAGYTPGRFPRVEVFELPFVHDRDAVATNLAIQDIYERHLADDFTEVHPLLIHVHAGQAFNTVGTPIRALEDLVGKRIRIPSRTGGWMLEAFGASGIGMPVPAIPLAMDKDIVDGALVPLEIALPLKLHERTNAATVGHGDTRFGNSVFIFAMNKDAYNNLPPDLQGIIDANSGANLATEAGDIWMQSEKRSWQIIEASGNEIVELSELEMERFRQAAATVIDRWIDEVATEGLDGDKLVKAARHAIGERQVR